MEQVSCSCSVDVRMVLMVFVEMLSKEVDLIVAILWLIVCLKRRDTRDKRRSLPTKYETFSMMMGLFMFRTSLWTRIVVF